MFCRKDSVVHSLFLICIVYQTLKVSQDLSEISKLTSDEHGNKQFNGPLRREGKGGKVVLNRHSVISS